VAAGHRGRARGDSKLGAGREQGAAARSLRSYAGEQEKKEGVRPPGCRRQRAAPSMRRLGEWPAGGGVQVCACGCPASNMASRWRWGRTDGGRRQTEEDEICGAHFIFNNGWYSKLVVWVVVYLYSLVHRNYVSHVPFSTHGKRLGKTPECSRWTWLPRLRMALLATCACGLCSRMVWAL
jgi:hypothetical protein